MNMGEPPIVAAMTMQRMQAGMKPTTMTTRLKAMSMMRLTAR